MTALSKAVQEAELFLASYDAAMEDPEQNHTLVAQQDAMPLAESLRSVLAALSTPTADDVREALAFALFRHEYVYASDAWAEATWPRSDQLRQVYQEKADAILAVFVVRPYGTVAPTTEDWAAQMDAERERQIEHGYDDAHDAEHGVAHLLNWAIDYARRGNNLAAATMARCALRLPYGTVTDTEVDWEYRAVAREPDTGELYDSLGPFLSETEAHDEADTQDLIRESDGSLPQLVLHIERRRKAGVWVALESAREVRS